MNLAELRASMKEKLDSLTAYRALKAEERTEEARTKMKADMESVKQIESDIRDLEEIADMEKRNNQSTNGLPPSGGEFTNSVEVVDQPIYRGSSATQLGAQLLDIRATSPGTQAASEEVSEARARLEQNETRNLRRNKISGELHKREKRAAGSGGFTLGGDGGHFLQGETAMDLMTAGFNNSAVLSMTSNRTMGPGTQFLEVIGVDETSRATGSRAGGVRIYTTAELDAITASKTNFWKYRIEPKKLTGHYVASSEMVSNVTFLGQEMRQLFGEEFAFKGQDLVLNGTGSGEPLGILKAPCLISQAKVTGQAADTIVLDNILDMEGRLANETPQTAYLINRECRKPLSTLTQPVGTGGSSVKLFENQYNMGKRDSFLNGIPCHTIEQASALGDAGDIILGDFSQYVTANRGDMNEAMSVHVYFLYDQSAFRFVWYFDGQPRWKSAITPYKGSATTSPFVSLAARA